MGIELLRDGNLAGVNKLKKKKNIRVRLQETEEVKRKKILLYLNEIEAGTG